MQIFKSVEQIINQLKPEKPIYCIRKNSIRSAVKYFNKNFPGKILYEVNKYDKTTIIKYVTRFLKKYQYIYIIFSQLHLFVKSYLISCRNNIPTNSQLWGTLKMATV